MKSHSAVAIIFTCSFCAIAMPKEDAQLRASANDAVQCSTDKECVLLWKQARRWIERHSQLKITTDTDDVIKATRPSDNRHMSRLAYTVTRVAAGNSDYQIQVAVDCANPLGCTPMPDKMTAKFNEDLRVYKSSDKFMTLASAGNVTAASAAQTSTQRNTQQSAKGDNLDEVMSISKSQGCGEQSAVDLLRKDGTREIYEIACVREIEHFVVRCDGGRCKRLD